MYAVRLYVILLAQGGHVHKILLFCIAFINVSTFLKVSTDPVDPAVQVRTGRLLYLQRQIYTNL